LDNHTYYYGVVGKRIGEMYRGDAFSPSALTAWWKFCTPVC